MQRARLLLGLVSGALLALATTVAAQANVALTQVSSDPYTNTTSFHATQLEPDTFSNASTIVSTFQSGRFQDGGASNIGFATSSDAGASWTHGFLPDTTVFATPAGPYGRDTDPSVAFDASHGVWLINSLPLNQSPGGGVTGVAVIVNRSTNGGTVWGNPVVVAAASGASDFDKNWIACDNTSSSPFFGSCYVQWDDFGHNNQLHMAFSRDGGQTWTEGSVPRRSSVIGGQPLVQPNGTVIVPIGNGVETTMESFVSTSGGASFTGPFVISSITSHTAAGSLRTSPLPSAEIDAAGTVYVVWQDCRFISRCTANDIVISTSSDGVHWSAVARIPIDPTTSGVDHFIPGLAVDRSTSGAGAHLGLTYYFYPNTACTTSTCQLDVGFISSADGGSVWSASTQLAGPMSLSSLPNTSQGFMVGDYISTSFVATSTGNQSLSVFAVGLGVSGTTCTLGAVTSCNEPMFAPSSALATAAAAGTSAVTAPILSRASDHAAPATPLTHR
jgi:hypothetical protein